MPFDVQFGPPQNVETEVLKGAYSLDFAGSGGALANGTVTLGGVDWTLSGVGDTALGTSIQLETPFTNIFPDFDGSKHTIEITTNEYEASGTWEHRVYTEFIRYNAAKTRYNSTSQYLYGSQRAVYTFVYAASPVYAGYLAYGDFDVQGRGVLCAGNVGKSGYYVGASPPDGPVRTDEMTALYASGADTTYGAASPFSSTDVLVIRIWRHSGASAPAPSGHTATQSASGLKLLNGGVNLSIRKLHLYFGVPE